MRSVDRSSAPWLHGAMDANQRRSRFIWLLVGALIGHELVNGHQCGCTGPARAYAVLMLLGGLSAWFGKPALRPWVYLFIPPLAIAFHP